MSWKSLLGVSVLSGLVALSGCGEDVRRGGDSGPLPTRDGGSVPFDGGGIPFDSGPSGVTCFIATGGGGATCLIGYQCSNSFTYQVECDGINCECRENNLPQSSFEQLNFCGDITPAFQSMLAKENCGWNFELEDF